MWCGLTSEGGLIAVKQIELNAADHHKAQREYEKVQEEVELLKNLRHKNIVGLVGSVTVYTQCRQNVLSVSLSRGARCSSVVRAFAHGGMGRRINPSWDGPTELFLVPISAPRLV